MTKAQDQKLKQDIESEVRRFLEECGALEQDEKPVPTQQVEGLRRTLISKYKKQATKAGKCNNCDSGWKKLSHDEFHIEFALKLGTVATNG